jgi:plasmid stabilization system protein ParE
VKITYRQAARDDVTRQFRYYLVTLDLAEVAIRFKEAVRKTAKAIREQPRAAPPYHLRNPQLKNLYS